MRKAFLQLHIAVFLAGFTGVLGRLITLNEGLLVWYRLLLTSIVLWIMYYWKRQPLQISRNELMKIFGVGALAAFHWVTFYGSIKYSNVSVALVCFSSIGFFTAIAEPLVFKTRVNRFELLLSLLTIAGIGIIFHFDPSFKTGIILGLISALLGAFFPVFNRKLVEKHKPETVTLLELTGGFLVLCILLPGYLHLFPATHLVPTASDFGWLLVLSVVCTVYAFNLTMIVLKKISAFTVNLSFNLEPLYGILLAFIIYQENKSLSDGFYFGLALIVLSVLLQTFFIYRSHRLEKARQHG